MKSIQEQEQEIMNNIRLGIVEDSEALKVKKQAELEAHEKEIEEFKGENE